MLSEVVSKGKKGEFDVIKSLHIVTELSSITTKDKLKIQESVLLQPKERRSLL